MHDTDLKKSTLYAIVDVKSILGPASMEFVMMLSFNETGDKVTRIDEFFDSAVYSDFFGKLQQHVIQGQ